MISLRIDVTKIEKERLYVGDKGTYLDVVLIPTPNSDYGDYMAVQSVTKEEREQGVKGPILGNAKEFKASVNTESLPPDPDSSNPPGKDLSEKPDDLPF